MSIAGLYVTNVNFRLRFFVIIFMGVIAFGSVLYWRSQLMLASEYLEFPETEKVRQAKEQNRLKRHGLKEAMNNSYELE